jgi:hypothetical protein
MDACDMSVYAAHVENAVLLAILNKSGDPAQARLHGGMNEASECWRLTGLSLHAMEGVQFVRAKQDEQLVSGYSAALWKFVLR